MNTEADSVRIDLWLWAVRIFKTRSDSNSACRSTRIKLNGNTAKPASKVRIGDEICIRKNSYTQKLIVKELIEKRVGGHIALSSTKGTEVKVGLRKKIVAPSKT